MPHAPLEIGEEQLRAVLDSMPARVALLDRARRHRYVNHEYARFLGQDRAAILGRTVAEVIGATAYELVRPHGDRALAGETVRWSGWLPYRDGEARYVQRTYTPYHGPAGTVDGYLVFSRDLTDLKRNEEQLAQRVAALHASEALNAAITASALDCVVVIDKEGRVVEFNPAAERTFGYARADALGQMIGDLIVPPTLRRHHADGLARYLRDGAAHVLGRRLELEAMRADGTLFPVELAITEVRLPDRHLFTAYLRDLTAARNAAEELRRGRDALHQNEKMAAFGSLLAGVSHELNNPLAIVIGNALMLAEEAREAGADAAAASALAERAETVRQAAERCGRIVKTFLSMARQRPLSREKVDLGALVRSVLELLGYGLRTRGVLVAVDAPALPGAPCCALGDPDQLSQVLSNLLINAQQVLEDLPGERRIAVQLRAEAGWATVTVDDNGPGVPAAIRARIFDPFFTTKAAGQGTGIGLAVSRGIAEAHGGTLVLSDVPGGGARFVLRLPAAADTPAPARKAGGTAPAVAAARTALIADDEVGVARVLAQMLRRLGFRCDLAGGGAEAQRALEARDYDAVFCDLHMPGTDGPALFGWLCARRPHLAGRVVFITGDTLGEHTAAFLRGAGRPVIEKPFNPAELAQVVGRLGPATPRATP